MRPILAWIGIAAGVLALAAALLPVRLAPLVDRPKPIEQSVAERVKEIRDRALDLFKSGAERSQPPKPRPVELREMSSAATLTLGFVAFVLGVLSFVRHEPLRAGAASAMFGTVAIAFEAFSYAVIMLAAVVVLLVVLGRMKS